MLWISTGFPTLQHSNTPSKAREFHLQLRNGVSAHFEHKFIWKVLIMAQFDPSSSSATGFLQALQRCAPLKRGLPHEEQ